MEGVHGKDAVFGRYVAGWFYRLVFVVPVLLGDGVLLFSQPGGTRVRLERLSVTHGPLEANLWLRVVDN